jgi:hypothetical protein
MATYNITANSLSGAGIFNIFAIPDSSAQDFINATGIADTIQQNAICDLVRNLKNYGLWSKMKAVYPFVTDNRNLFGYTEDLNTWITGDVTKTLNYATAPDGSNTAIRIQGTTNAWFLGTNLPTTLASNKVFSVYIKSNTGSSQQFRFFYQNTPVSGNYTVTTSWQRIEFTVNTVTTSGQVTGFCRDSANNTADLLMWHPQAEEGTVATTYQPIATNQQAYIASQFKYNLVNPVDSDAAFRLVFNGGWTHSSNGATPNGVNGYADTKLNAGVELNGTSAHASLYPRTSLVGGYGIQGDFTSRMDIINFGGVLYSAIGTTGQTSYTGTYSGLIVGSRTSSTSNKLYVGGTLRDTKTTSSTANFQNTNYWLGACNLNTFYSSNQTAFASIGDGLTDTEAANLYTAVQAFQTALSRQV